MIQDDEKIHTVPLPVKELIDTDTLMQAESDLLSDLDVDPEEVTVEWFGTNIDQRAGPPAEDEAVLLFEVESDG